MDILHLVDRLEELFNEGRPIWFTHHVAVDEDRILDLIDQMRVSIPEAIKKAQQIITQRERDLAQAREKPNRIKELAREEAGHLVLSDSVTLNAQAEAKRIIAQAHMDAAAARQEADEYILQSLTNLEMELDRILNQVRNGIHTVQEERSSNK